MRASELCSDGASASCLCSSGRRSSSLNGPCVDGSSRQVQPAFQPRGRATIPAMCRKEGVLSWEWGQLHLVTKPLHVMEGEQLCNSAEIRRRNQSADVDIESEGVKVFKASLGWMIPGLRVQRRRSLEFPPEQRQGARCWHSHLRRSGLTLVLAFALPPRWAPGAL